MSPELIKRAKVTIRDLSEETESLAEELSIVKQAQTLAFNLWKSGIITTEDVEEKIAEFSEKSKQELEVFEKAAELAQTSGQNFNGLGSLSERPQDDGSLDPLTRMLITDL